MNRPQLERRQAAALAYAVADSAENTYARDMCNAVVALCNANFKDDPPASAALADRQLSWQACR
jgi:hypothetical protein